MMKNLLALMVFAIVASPAYSQQHMEVCKADKLTPKQAKGRIYWAQVCAKEHIIAWYNRAGLPEDSTSDEKIADSIDYWLNHKGAEKKYPSYPTFSDGEVNGQGWRAPISITFAGGRLMCPTPIPQQLSIFIVCFSKD